MCELSESVALIAQMQEISADDSRIHVVGRYMAGEEAGSIKYDWAGVQVEIAVQPVGAAKDSSPVCEVQFDMMGGGNLFSVQVDGRSVLLLCLDR